MSNQTGFGYNLKVSPTILSVASLPLVALWIVSGIIYNLYQVKGDMDAIPGFWLGIFLVGGPLAATVVGAMVTIRVQEHRQFTVVDKVAIWVSVIGAVFCVGSLAYAYFQATRPASL